MSSRHPSTSNNTIVTEPGETLSPPMSDTEFAAQRAYVQRANHKPPKSSQEAIQDIFGSLAANEPTVYMRTAGGEVRVTTMAAEFGTEAGPEGSTSTSTRRGESGNRSGVARPIDVHPIHVDYEKLTDAFFHAPPGSAANAAPSSANWTEGHHDMSPSTSRVASGITGTARRIDVNPTQIDYGKLTDAFFDGSPGSAAKPALSNPNWTEARDDVPSRASRPGDILRGGNTDTQMGTNVNFHEPQRASGMTRSEQHQAATDPGAAYWTYGSSNTGTAFAASYGDTANIGHTTLIPQQLAPSFAQATSLAPWVNANARAPQNAAVQSGNISAGAEGPAGMQIQYHSSGLPGSKPSTQIIASMDEWQRYNHVKAATGPGTTGRNWKVVDEGPSLGGAIFVAYEQQDQDINTRRGDFIVEVQEPSLGSLTFVPHDPVDLHVMTDKGHPARRVASLS